MKDLKLRTKIIRMVSIILVLMVISSGFWIIKISSFSDEVKGIAGEAALKAEHDEKSALIGMSIISVFSAIFGLLMGIFISRGITKSNNRIVVGLNEGSDQIVSSSGQVSSAGQQLVEGSSEQPASIEETSSSLEEMSSMTKQNAANAGQTDNFMKEAKRAVCQAKQMKAIVSELAARVGVKSKDAGR